MLLSEVEKLKRELTDKFVIVQEGIPELRRFVGRTGVVKTVNMNGRALVQFQGLEDIAWYDIDPRFLTVVDKPIEPPPREEAKPAPAAKPAAKPAGASPLELARQQGPAKAEGEKKLSPLELARMQGPAKGGGQAPATGRAEAATAGGEQTTSGAAAEGKKLSPLELARMQGPAKRPGTETSSAGETTGGEQDAASSSEASKQTATGQGGKQLTGPDGRTLSPLELARLQGPYKGDK